MIMIFAHSCKMKNQINYTDEIYGNGPLNFPSILVRSTHCIEPFSCENLYMQFIDSLYYRNLPIMFKQVTYIDEFNQNVGISYFVGEPDYIDIDLIEFWIQVNFNSDLGIHIDTANFRDSLFHELELIDKESVQLYNKISQNPEEHSIARPHILISLNIKTSENNHISRKDYDKLVGYFEVLTSTTVARVNKLSFMLWKKPYIELEVNQKVAICSLLGYISNVNITN